MMRIKASAWLPDAVVKLKKDWAQLLGGASLADSFIDYDKATVTDVFWCDVMYP